MTEIVQFPGATPAPEVHTELDRNEVHSKAFRDMEGEVCDLDRMGEIAQNLIMNCEANADSFHDLELAWAYRRSLATFAVWQLAKVAKEFRASYFKCRRNGEQPN